MTITTGRRVLAGEADGLSRFVVMLDNEMAFRRFAGEDIEIYWGAYLGTRDEILVAGKLARRDGRDRAGARPRRRRGMAGSWIRI